MINRVLTLIENVLVALHTNMAKYIVIERNNDAVFIKLCQCPIYIISVMIHK